jgi:hypothetical protein
MTQEAVKALNDDMILQVIAWGEAELAARKEQRKQDAIAKIRELAAAVGVSVAIDGMRGRPRRKTAAKPDQIVHHRPAVAAKTSASAASVPTQGSRVSSTRS